VHSCVCCCKRDCESICKFRCCSVLQCVAVCCRSACLLLLCTAVAVSGRYAFPLLQCVAVWCDVVQCVAVCCRSACLLLLSIAVAMSCQHAFPLLLCATVCCSVVQCVAAHGVLQHICLLQCVSASCSTSVDSIRISTSFMYACVYLHTCRRRRVQLYVYVVCILFYCRAC